MVPVAVLFWINLDKLASRVTHGSFFNFVSASHRNVAQGKCNFSHMVYAVVNVCSLLNLCVSIYLDCHIAGGRGWALSGREGVSEGKLSRKLLFWWLLQEWAGYILSPSCTTEHTLHLVFPYPGRLQGPWACLLTPLASLCMAGSIQCFPGPHISFLSPPTPPAESLQSLLLPGTSQGLKHKTISLL